eukprot:10861544-Alexandrium_andersonii.AAC.1
MFLSPPDAFVLRVLEVWTVAGQDRDLANASVHLRPQWGVQYQLSRHRTMGQTAPLGDTPGLGNTIVVSASGARLTLLQAVSGHTGRLPMMQ